MQDVYISLPLHHGDNIDSNEEITSLSIYELRISVRAKDNPISALLLHWGERFPAAAVRPPTQTLLFTVSLRTSSEIYDPFGRPPGSPNDEYVVARTPNKT